MTPDIESVVSFWRVFHVPKGVIAVAPLVLPIVMANVQGATAPLSSVMGLLPMNGSVLEVADVRAQFAAGTTTPVTESLISDFRTYHLSSS